MILAVSFVFEAIYIIKNYNLLFGGNLESGRIDAMAGNGILLYGMWLGIIAVCLLFELMLRKDFSKKFSGQYVLFMQQVLYC